MASNLPDNFQLGHQVIDRLHEEIHELVEHAAGVTDGELAATLAAILQHCELHFAYEEQQMTDHRYGGLQEHRHEHNKLLMELKGMSNSVSRGRYRFARAWLQERLPEWLQLHIANLDGLLVAFLSRSEPTCDP